MQNRGRVINTRSKANAISDDINDLDSISKENEIAEEVNKLSKIKNYDEYCAVFQGLIYLESKYESDLTEQDELVIEKAKKLIRRFKLTIELERSNTFTNELEVRLDNDSLIEILKGKGIDTKETHFRYREMLNLILLIEEDMRSILENRVVNHLAELIEEYDAGGWLNSK